MDEVMLLLGEGSGGAGAGGSGHISGRTRPSSNQGWVTWSGVVFIFCFPFSPIRVQFYSVSDVETEIFLTSFTNRAVLYNLVDLLVFILLLLVGLSSASTLAGDWTPTFPALAGDEVSVCDGSPFTSFQVNKYERRKKLGASLDDGTLPIYLGGKEICNVL